MFSSVKKWMKIQKSEIQYDNKNFTNTLMKDFSLDSIFDMIFWIVEGLYELILIRTGNNILQY